MKSLSTLYWCLSLGISILLFSSCTGNDPQPTSGITLEFDNIVGSKNLVLNGPSGTNASGEDFVITKFDYFISNIKLLRADGSNYTIPQDSSYFLVKESIKESQFVRLKNVPLGDYTGVEFMVGVDSLRSVSPIEKRKGALDPAGTMDEGMYWAWNSGYIFMKLEGTSSKSTAVANKFYYHIGLFGGMDVKTVNNTRIVKVPFGDLKATVTMEETPEVHLFVDALKVFDGPAANISIAQYNSIMSGQQSLSQQVANNYAKIFTLDHIHN